MPNDVYIYQVVRDLRIIHWNCQGAFRHKTSKILDLNPDVLIISECENLEKIVDALSLASRTLHDSDIEQAITYRIQYFKLPNER